MFGANLMRRLSATSVAVALFVAFFAAGCKETTPPDVEGDTANNAAGIKVEQTLKSMTLAEKIGQMVMIGVLGTETDDDIRFMLRQYHIGGVIFYDRNLSDAAQVQKFTADLQKSADGKAPLLIGIDEEGGRVVRMPQIVTPPPSPRELGDAGDVSAVESIATKTAAELKNLGINVNFAPVADVGESQRCFSSDADSVAKFAVAAANGYLAGGVLPCFKHFPGLGKGQANTHFQAVTVTATKDELNAEDIVPFKKAIDETDKSRCMIMVSHIDYTELDSENPASLSPVVQTDILRRELNFDGVVVSDDLEMAAVSERYPFAELGVKAALAGLDMVMVCHDYNHAADVYLGLLNAAEQGILTEERVNQSVRRILLMKQNIPQ